MKRYPCMVSRPPPWWRQFPLLQAMVLVDAKVKQVVVHVDRHMSFIQEDVNERLRTYEKTIIRVSLSPKP